MFGSSSVHSSEHRETAVDRGLLVVMALAGGLSVANLYYIQPLGDVVAKSLGVGPAQAGTLASFTQLGFVIGLWVVIPLGDKLAPRFLVTFLLPSAAGAFVVAALAPTIAVLGIAMVALGASSVAAQILVPFAAALAPSGERGRVVGVVMTGVLMGTLLSRTISGAVGGIVGWRSMCWLGAIVMLGLVPLLRSKLPDLERRGAPRYSELLHSIADLVRDQALLRWRASYGTVAFAAFSGYWTAVPFLLARSPFELGAAATGVVALVGVPSAFIAPCAGRLADRDLGEVLTAAYLLLIATGIALTFVAAQHLSAVILGGLLVTVGSGCLHVTNQTMIYGLDPGARSRLATAYMTALFAGGMAGSSLAAVLYAAGGWSTVCLSLFGLTLGGFGIWIIDMVMSSQPAAAGRPIETPGR